ncbi:hypothetical protein [Pedobacter frigoris]|uniref:Uncharacterized protein n=1 Tax=Pedobacter frigoris TaxID=2571272 RepID=A0A4U1CKC1_9SPHI|nr:hypothetical protein [Pedobacter frigoris]TKC05879.1 hypothetical protein FA047_11080 [Pedobacter frigoris]
MEKMPRRNNTLNNNMTPRKKILFIVLGLLLILTILITVRIFSSSDKDSVINSVSNSSWSDESTSMTIGEVKEVKSKYKPADLSLVVLLDEDTLYKDINKLLPIVLTIDSYEVGSLWMPLRKSADFSATGSIKINRKVETTSGSDLTSSFTMKLSGQFTVSGSVALNGFYSHKEAKKLVQDLVVENFVAKAKEHFSTFSPEYLQNFAAMSIPSE